MAKVQYTANVAITGTGSTATLSTTVAAGKILYITHWAIAVNRSASAAPFNATLWLQIAGAVYDVAAGVSSVSVDYGDAPLMAAAGVTVTLYAAHFSNGDSAFANLSGYLE